MILINVALGSRESIYPCRDDETGLTEEDFLPLAIPLELEIEITVLKDESEAEDLYSNTTTLLTTFDPSKVIIIHTVLMCRYV